MFKLSNLGSLLWWNDAARRAVYTAVALALPYLGGALIVEVPWITIALVAALGFVASLATSLAGLPEASGVNLPWWLAAIERVVKTFAQALVAGFVGATLITDVPWPEVLQAAALAALVSLLRLILATLPSDPTVAVPQKVIFVQELLDPSTSPRSAYWAARDALKGGNG